MKNLFIISAFILISLLSFSCSKDSSEQIDIVQLYNCHKSQKYDSTKLASKLIGTWKWTTYSAEIPGTIKADKNVFLNLTKEGEFTVTENSVVVTRGNWKLKVADIDLFALDLNNPSTYLYGRILLCENLVLFNNSYIDGGDNLFVRIDY
ncbi:MAG: hypothetical protein ACOYEG_11595 [Petrimonas sp.]|jgi:hypothetical protein